MDEERAEVALEPIVQPDEGPDPARAAVLEDAKLASPPVPGGTHRNERVPSAETDGELREILARLDATGSVPDADDYQRLCGLTVKNAAVDEVSRLDPFSDAYRAAAMRIYLDLRGRPEDGYEPFRDEAPVPGEPGHAFSGVVPWSFRDAGFAAEFLISYAHMLRLLRLPPRTGASVLEYGPGSGQLLLMLAKLGYRAFGVDIDATALASIKRQADAMGVEVATECAQFGEGFGQQRFDRIVFFEAFHHAFDFADVLRRLRSRLAPGGHVVFCGEPIVPAPTSAVPYPWGPRLDGLSVFCIRRFGWMELGFTATFFTAALRRAGWRVRAHPFPGCPRADAFVAKPFSDAEMRGDYELWFDRSGAAPELDADHWAPPEDTHAWTISPAARLALLHGPGAEVDIRLRVANFLPLEKRLRVVCGDRAWEGSLPPGSAENEIDLHRCRDDELLVECETHRPIDLVPGSADERSLGVAVRGLRSVPAAAPSR